MYTMTRLPDFSVKLSGLSVWILHKQHPPSMGGNTGCYEQPLRWPGLHRVPNLSLCWPATVDPPCKPDMLRLAARLEGFWPPLQTDCEKISSLVREQASHTKPQLAYAVWDSVGWPSALQVEVWQPIPICTESRNRVANEIVQIIRWMPATLWKNIMVLSDTGVPSPCVSLASVLHF